ncbi:DNA topoisomerase [Streptobacillus moniliformis]|uniref:DNA topoisomerase n=1 Tax=Streptobacillus moniliformis (strain ATCC 14647 / DSM 12112 / NCTC 10651 / 9901) TaxID=519441 RepID=D1AV52_STRM9|nr:DNA topoisomerase [Streptobacillus moniliformis]ACZ01612.1 DNA topoisomerase type IA central domain protein [Streptobacillus moniliformis DSM 12112]AVL43384.1 DNA topoisomerase [Streptobacillus moniliformis]SQA13209.1 DNA topoisomerase 3 [Streptobacillus moniliformis]
MKLIIAEKGSLGRNIAQAIGIIKKNEGYIECKNDFVVTNAIGHLLELKQPKDYEENVGKKWREYTLPFIPNNFVYEVKDDVGVKKQLNVIKGLMKKADLIINCGDADREGQIIVDNLLKFNVNKAPVKRLWLPEQTEETIRKELNNLKDNSDYYNLQQEGYARAYMDYLLGHNLTIMFTNLSGKMLNAGRVLVPIVKYIYDRDKEIKNFIVEKYYSVENENIVKLISSNKFKTIEEAKIYSNKLNSKKAKVIGIDSKEVKKQSKKLFSLSTLQSELSKKYKINFANSLKIIQELYEKGYLTYPRTNTEYLSENEKGKVNDILGVLNNEDLEFKDSKKVFDDSKIESHSAITITTKIPGELSVEQDKVYKMVYNRFLSNFVKEDCIVSETTMIIKVDEEEFKLKGFVVKQLGFMKYEPKEYKDKLPGLNLNDEFDIEFRSVEKETTPPSKVNESELSKFLKNPFKKEKNATEEEIYKDILEGIEIGTEATRTGIIDKCVKIGYLTLDNGVFDVTELGIFFINKLIEYDINFFKEKSVEFSKLQKKVYKNEMKLEEVIKKVEYELKAIVERTKDVKMPNIERKIEDIKGVVEINTKNGKCYKGLFNNEEVWLYPIMKYFNNELKITKSIAEKLCKGNYVEFELDYKGKKYMQKLRIVRNGKYINFKSKN